MKSVGIVAFVHEVFGNFLGVELGAAEDDAIDVWIVIDDAFQSRIFVFRMYEIIHMIDVGRTFVFMSDSDLDCVVEILLCNLGNGLWHCCAEQHRAMFVRHTAQDGLYIVLETHVQHLVCFVEYQSPDLCQRDGSSLHEVDETAWSRNYDVYSTF